MAAENKSFSPTAAAAALEHDQLLLRYMDGAAEHPRWPSPGKGKNFSDALAWSRAAQELQRRQARCKAAFWMDTAPHILSENEKQRAAAFIEDYLCEHPAAEVAELLWIVAADATLPSASGRPTRWNGAAGRSLVELVDAGLNAMGLRRDRKKGLRRVLAVLRKELPDYYGGYTEEQLRQGYYAALRSQSKKSPH